MVARDMIDGLRKRLEDERAELVSQLDAMQIDNDNQQTDYGVGNHLADDASELFLRERNIALRGNAEELIAQIDGALKRMDAGSYGTCERCGQPIAAERLEALPYAAYCITCQSEVERER
jgi:DnaK suppressor protein